VRMKWLFDLIGTVLQDLHRNLWALLLYHAIFVLLSLFLLTPLLSWVASSSGRLSINNGEVLSFLLSPRGVLFILLVGSVKVVTLYVKHAGMMLIAWESIAGRPMSALRAFWEVMQRLPGLTLLGCYHVAAHVILLAPFAILGTLVYRFAFSSMRMYFLFLESAAARWIALAVALLLAAAIIVIHGAVYLHWVFSLPALLVGDRSAASGLTYTHDPVREMKRRIGVVVFSFWMVIILLPFALAQGFHSVGGKVFTRLPEEHRLVMPVVLMLMAGYLATSFIGEFLTVAVNSLTITRLYAGLRQTRGAKKGDSVLVRTEASQQERREEEAEYPLSSGVAEPVAPYSPRHPHPRQIVAFMILAAVVSLATAATILSDFDLHENVKITAHRGGSFSAPENTLAAIHSAVEEGADYAEVDVRLTADGYAVLLHDKDLFRVAGVKKSLSELTYEQIKTLDAGSWFAPQFRDERIPLLSDVVAFSAGRIKLNIELKTNGAPRRLAEQVVQILHEHEAVSECVVSSASIEALEHLRNLDPSIRTGCVISQSIGEVTALNVDFLSVSSCLATPGLIGAAHAAGKEVHVWTVEKPRQMARFIDIGVDNLITDVPSVARSVLDERAAMSTEELLFMKVRSWFLR